MERTEKRVEASARDQLPEAKFFWEDERIVWMAASGVESIVASGCCVAGLVIVITSEVAAAKEPSTQLG